MEQAFNKMSKEDNEALNAEWLELHRLAHEVFISNESGKKLLDLLKERMIMNCVTANPDQSTAHAYFNEGRNSTIRMLSQYAEHYPALLKERMKNKELENKK